MAFVISEDGQRRGYCAATAARHIAYMCLPYQSTLGGEGVAVDLSGRWDLVDALVACKAGEAIDELTAKVLDGRIRYNYTREAFFELEAWRVVSADELVKHREMQKRWDVQYQALQGEIRELRERLGYRSGQAHPPSLSDEDAKTIARLRLELAEAHQAREEAERLNAEALRNIATQSAREAELAQALGLQSGRHDVARVAESDTSEVASLLMQPIGSVDRVTP